MDEQKGKKLRVVTVEECKEFTNKFSVGDFYPENFIFNTEKTHNKSIDTYFGWLWVTDDAGNKRRIVTVESNGSKVVL